MSGKISGDNITVSNTIDLNNVSRSIRELGFPNFLKFLVGFAQ